MKTNKTFFERKIVGYDQIDIVNYISDCFNDRENYIFLGFIKIKSEVYDYIGYDFGNGDKYSGICYFEDSEIIDDSEESAGINKTKPHIIMLIGVDDSSYFKRFGSKQEAIYWFNKRNKIIESDIEQMFYFN
jgi:hypothetical protein